MATATATAGARRALRAGSVRARSRLFVPTSREAPAGAVARSHELLVRAGFARQSAAGVYQLLPLAERVLARLEALIDLELQREPLAADKLRLPLLSPAERWQRSGRWDVYGDELIRLEDRKGQAFCLGPTFEEEITDLVAAYGPRVARELPIKLYQISTKYRDEVRPRFGLLRGREFIMKDLYSFHRDLDCAKETYEQVCAAYRRIFDALGLDYVQVLADSGAMGGNYTHEFQVLADVGEDDLVYCDRGDFRANIETLVGSDDEAALEGAVERYSGSECQHAGCSCGGEAGAGRGTLRVKRGIEVGQAFLLGTKYSECFQALWQEPDGRTRSPLYMACFGIGVSRVMAAAIENVGGSDESGIIWPTAIAPFDVAVITGPGNKSAQAGFQEHAIRLAEQLGTAHDVLLDDRWGESFGRRLAEAKLIGYPKILVAGKHCAQGNVEVIDRATLESRVMPEGDAMAELLGRGQ